MDSNTRTYTQEELDAAVAAAKVQAASDIKYKIHSAYLSRDDYPPMALVGFEDRGRYGSYIDKLIEEYSNEQKGANNAN